MKYAIAWANPSHRLFSSSRSYRPRLSIPYFLIALVLVSVFYWYFGTQQGASIRATGNNQAMSRALGVNVDNMKVLGLSLSNGVVALSGGLMAQYQGFADVQMGRGAIVIGLAAIIIGEVLHSVLAKHNQNFAVRLAFVVIGGIVYYLVMGVALWLRLPTNDLKLFTAIIVAVFLAIPQLRKKGYKSSKKNKSREEASAHG